MNEKDDSRGDSLPLLRAVAQPTEVSWRQRVRLRLAHSFFASYWLAELHSKALGLMSLRHRVKQFGRCHIALGAKVTGWASCSFGRNSVIGTRTWINVNNRSAGAPSIEIGDNAFIGQDNFFTSGRRIRIGPYCLTAAHCTFIGSTHLVDNPWLPYATTGTSMDAIIEVGANCFFGYGAMVLGDVCIGHGCIVGAGSVVRHDVAPFSVVVGNPAKVVKHFDFVACEWRAGPRPDDALNTVPPEEAYLQHLCSKYPYVLQPVSAASSWLGSV